MRASSLDASITTVAPANVRAESPATTRPRSHSLRGLHTVLSRGLPVVALLAIVSLSLLDGLIARVVAAERDTGVFYYPLLRAMSAQMRAEGQVPLWSPLIFGGYPIFADGELGLAYPPMLLMLWRLPADAVLVLSRTFHVGMAALGTYALARAWQLPRLSAVLAGVVFSLGSFMQAQIHHENIIRTAAWLPLQLALAELALRARGRARARWVAAAGVAVGLSALGLHVQILAINLLAVAGYGLTRWWAGPIGGACEGTGVRQRPRAVAFVFPPIAALGIGLGAVQLVPLAELARASMRGAGLPYAESAAYSLTPFDLVKVLFPFFFRGPANQEWSLWIHWESYLYVGLAPLLLVVVALVRVRRREVWGWATMAGVALLLALGQYSPLNLHYALTWLPGMSSLRAPGRFTLVVTLALAMLAAHGLAWLQASRENLSLRRVGASRTTGALLLLPLVLVGALAGVRLGLLAAPEAAQSLIQAAYLSLPRDVSALAAADVYAGLLWSTDPLNARVTGTLVALAALALVLRARETSRWRAASAWRGWPILLLAAATLDLLWFSATIHPRVALGDIARAATSVEAVARLQAQDAPTFGPARVLASPVLEQAAPDRLAPLGLADANGYSSLESRRHRDYTDRVFAVADDLLDLLNVRYVLEPSRFGAMSTYRGVQFLPGRALLKAPAGSALGVATFDLSRGQPAVELQLVTALVNGVEIEDGTPVLEVQVRDAAGRALGRATLLAGRDTMEWARDVPGIEPRVRHGRAEVAGRAFEWRDGRRQERLLSFARVPLDPEAMRAASVLELRAVPPQGEMVVYGATLVDAAGTAVPLFDRDRAKFREVYRDGEVRVLRNDAALPRSFVVAAARTAARPGAALDEMQRRPFDPRREVILGRASGADPGIQPLPPAGGTPSRAAIERYTSQAVDVRVVQRTGGYLVLSDTYYPGWTAYVDGQPRPILRADALFRAVQVPAGEHLVTFRYEPRSVPLGLGISLATLAAMLLLLLGSWTRGVRRRAPRPG